MALVLRKAVMPRNVSLFKCIKGRNLATTSNRKHSLVISTAAPRRRWREEHRRPTLAGPRIEKSRRLLSTKPDRGADARKAGPVRCSTSCPDLEARAKAILPPRHHSPCPPRTEPSLHEADPRNTIPPCQYLAATACCMNKCAGKKPPSPCKTPKREFSKCPPPCPPPCPPCGPPCPPCGPCGPCCGCNPCCLPPPCNSPPKCLQYMTGYYYYPYGFWFCGPYHVSGVCCPVSCPSGPKCPPCPCPAPCCICPSAAATLGASAAAPACAPENQPPCKALQWQKTWKNTFPNKAPKASQSSLTPCPPQDASAKAVKPGVSRFLPFCSDKSSSGAPPNARSFSTFSTTSFPSCKQNCPRCQGWACGNISTTLPRYQRSETMLSLDSPRALPSREERDKPTIKPGAFDYSSIPSYRYPYPPPPFSDIQPRAYDL